MDGNETAAETRGTCSPDCAAVLYRDVKTGGQGERAGCFRELCGQTPVLSSSPN
jgi:hypothetical protein